MEVFVFGSNEAGRHGKGAALEARMKWGAKLGVGKGLTGKSYAIPTKDKNLRVRSLEDIKIDVEEFNKFAGAHPEMTFILTRVGCGLAGYKEWEIRPMFKERENVRTSWENDVREGFVVLGKFIKWNMRKDIIPIGTLRMDRETRWGNPYDRGSRMENVENHMEYLRREWRRNSVTRELMMNMARAIKRGEDVNVSCWCSPLPCHLDNWERGVLALIEKGLV